MKWLTFWNTPSGVRVASFLSCDLSISYHNFVKISIIGFSKCIEKCQNPTFYPKIPWNLMFEKGEFCENWYFYNVNFVKIEVFKMWIL